MISRRILIVEDSVDSAAMLETILMISGHDARTAHTGGAAVDLARTFQPEIVFLDLTLPDIHGFELARRLRATPGLEHVVMVAMSGFSDDQTKRGAKEAGIQHYLVKPVEFATMEQLLATCGTAR